MYGCFHLLESRGTYEDYAFLWNSFLEDHAPGLSKSNESCKQFTICFHVAVFHFLFSQTQLLYDFLEVQKKFSLVFILFCKFSARFSCNLESGVTSISMSPL